MLFRPRSLCQFPYQYLCPSITTSPLPPFSHNDEIRMLGQKPGMAINELSINPFYIVYYVFIKKTKNKTFILYSDISMVYKRKTARSHISMLFKRHMGLVIIFIIFSLIICVSLSLFPPNLWLLFYNTESITVKYESRSPEATINK